jgi:hypothetical protein
MTYIEVATAFLYNFCRLHYYTTQTRDVDL